jgi:hypothetical protein
MRDRVGCAIFLLAAAVAAAPAFSEEAPQPARAVGDAKAAPGPPGDAAAPGLTVFVDPVTKAIRPAEPGEAERLLQGAARRPLAAPRALTNLAPGVGVGFALDSSYEMFMVVTKKPDGTLATSCVTGDAEANAAVAAGAPASPAKAKDGKEARHAR